jgi:hypothetical protein
VQERAIVLGQVERIRWKGRGRGRLMMWIYLPTSTTYTSRDPFIPDRIEQLGNTTETKIQPQKIIIMVNTRMVYADMPSTSPNPRVASRKPDQTTTKTYTRRCKGRRRIDMTKWKKRRRRWGRV